MHYTTRRKELSTLSDYALSYGDLLANKLY